MRCFSLRVLENPTVVTGVEQALGFGKTLVRRSVSHPPGLPGLESQALAAPGTAPVQYLAAAFGRHARTEAVGAGAFEYAGLKCSFHSNVPEWL